MSRSISTPAIRIRQSGAIPIYIFALRADEIRKTAEVPRLSRAKDRTLDGYQRGAVRSHIADIKIYLEGDQVVFPNNIVLSLGAESRFIRECGGPASKVCTGTLEIPLLDPPTGRIIDGQQRVLALISSSKTSMPVPISAILTEDVGVQREQFLRINNVKPLPRGLVDELLPVILSEVPERLTLRRIAAIIVDRLDYDQSSPFRGLIRRSTSTSRSSVVAASSLITTVSENLKGPRNALFTFLNVATGDADIEGAYRVLQTYWSAVRDTFPVAWGLSPRRSRLMHGVGIRSMGRLMDRMISPASALELSREDLLERLSVLPHQCSWTDGVWEGLGGLAWNDLQNTPQHIRLLSDFLTRTVPRSESRSEVLLP